MDKVFSEERMGHLFSSYRNKHGLLLAQRRERTDLEFKESFNYANLRDYAREMVAFANTIGGYIIFGVKDSPHVLQGLNEKSLELFEGFEPSRVSRYFGNHFSSIVKFTHHRYKYEDKYFGIFYTFEAENKPVIAEASEDKGGEVLFSEGDILYRLFSAK